MAAGGGHRMATVIVSTGDGFVLAGRSLREVELRVDDMGKICLLAMLAIWVGTLILIALGELLTKKKAS